jgi:chromosome segregation ATPase
MELPSLVPLRFLSTFLQSPAPFFTNDIQGFLKLVGTFGSIVLLTAGIFVKWGQSAFAKRLDKVETDLNGVGGRIASLETGCASSNAKHEELRSRIDRREVVLDNLLIDMGKHDASILSTEKLCHGLQGSFIIMMNDALADRDKQITELRIALGKLESKLEERESSRAILKELLTQRKNDV